MEPRMEEDTSASETPISDAEADRRWHDSLWHDTKRRHTLLDDGRWFHARRPIREKRGLAYGYWLVINGVGFVIWGIAWDVIARGADWPYFIGGILIPSAVFLLVTEFLIRRRWLH